MCNSTRPPVGRPARGKQRKRVIKLIPDRNLVLGESLRGELSAQRMRSECARCHGEQAEQRTQREEESVSSHECAVAGTAAFRPSADRITSAMGRTGTSPEAVRPVTAVFS